MKMWPSFQSGYPEQSNYHHFLQVCGVCVCEGGSSVCYHSHLNFHGVVMLIYLGSRV